MINRLALDFVWAIRGLRTAPAIPIAAVITTSLAVAMNLAMAGVIDRALLSPPAHVAYPERVFTVGFEVTGPSGATGISGTASYPMFEAIRDRAPGIASAGWHYVTADAVVDENRFSVKATGVTGEYFTMLGSAAQLGRTVLPEDDRAPEGAPVAVISDTFWRTAFGGDPEVIGRLFQSGSLTLRVIGVMPAGFSGHTTERVDLWLPLSSAMRDLRGWHRQPNMAVVEIGVRLSAALGKSGAETQLTAVSGTRVILTPIIGADVAPEPHRIAMWLTAVSLIVLVAGLANVATLCLARGARRRREITIRAAMGATRGRLFRQLLIESAIAASAASAVAFLLGLWFDELIRRILFPSLVERSGTDSTVIVAVLVCGACTLIVHAGAGALQLPREVNVEDLNERRRVWRRSGVQRELLTLQTTLAVILVTGGGMFAQSYYVMAAQNHNARLDDVLVVAFPNGTGPVRDQDPLMNAAVERLRELPGVEAATVFGVLPFGNIHRPPISVPGVGEPRLDGQLPFMLEATPAFIDILGIDIVQGRGFTSDNDRGAPVVIVSESMARAVWPAANAIGKCIQIGFDPAFDPGRPARPSRPPASAPCREVIGVARDWRAPNAGRPGAGRIMHYYVPFAQGLQAPPWMVPWAMANGILLRKQPAIDLSAQSIRDTVAGGRGDLPFLDVQPYASFDRPRLAHWLVGTQLLLLFGALALLTTALGLYAAFAHAVTERRMEMAIRLAVGASRQRVLLMLLREAMVITARGAINGFVVAALVGWAARSMIFGLSSPGALVIAVVSGVVLIASFVGTWFPALAAARVEPNALLKID